MSRLALRLRPDRRILRGWGPAERRTLGIGLVAGVATSAALAVEYGRVWRRGSAPLPRESDDLLLAAEEAAAETARVAAAGYADVAPSEKTLFNLLASFVATFAIARGITYALRERATFGPFRAFRVGRRHIHHFVPGIALAFTSGAAAILTREEELERPLAVAFGVGMGLTLDESALLLELEDVYWTPEGLLSVQITMATMALLAVLALGLRFLRRGERIVLEDGSTASVERTT
ncbi:MAG TPA: hypothetical protein VGV57_07300 [Thermoleophilaceae bacterium]|nr:hypothetical protein [Thermoleophilaceae bacterium]